MAEFSWDTSKEFLAASFEENENRVYSPVNVFMALSMLAEMADGNSRQEILDFLKEDTIEDLRIRASNIWNVNYIIVMIPQQF